MRHLTDFPLCDDVALQCCVRMAHVTVMHLLPSVWRFAHLKFSIELTRRCITRCDRNRTRLIFWPLFQSSYAADQKKSWRVNANMRLRSNKCDYCIEDQSLCFCYLQVHARWIYVEVKSALKLKGFHCSSCMHGLLYLKRGCFSISLFCSVNEV